VQGGSTGSTTRAALLAGLYVSTSSMIDPDNPLEVMAEKAMALREKLGRKLTADEALELLEIEMERFETEKAFAI
jgi:NaMN:DMB phosphoribosyltransferase